MSDVTRILQKIEVGEPAAAELLLPLIYDELKQLAAQQLARERPGHTLQATALVHDAYLRLVDTDQQQNWNSRGHFFSAAAEAMRRILIESARRKRRVKHGGQLQRVNLDNVEIAGEAASDDMLALDEAMTRLGGGRPDQGEARGTAVFRWFDGGRSSGCAGDFRDYCQTVLAIRAGLAASGD